MKTVSEFQKILEEKLEQEAPKTKEAPKNFNSMPSESFYANFYFGNEFFKTQIFQKSSTYKSVPKEKIEVVVEVKPKAEIPKIEVKTEPSPRIKRSLSFDQTRAAKFFTSLGEMTDGYSTTDEIKSAYRRLAKKLHPDVGASASDTEKFKQLTLAYKLLIK